MSDGVTFSTNIFLDKQNNNFSSPSCFFELSECSHSGSNKETKLELFATKCTKTEDGQN